LYNSFGANSRSKNLSTSPTAAWWAWTTSAGEPLSAKPHNTLTDFGTENV
jgi:hypothetical protein